MRMKVTRRKQHNMDDKLMTAEQVQLSLMERNIKDLFKKKTPKEVIKLRKGAGGRMFPYVPIDYVLTELDRVFGIFWEFVVDEVKKTDTHIIILGKLVIKSPNGFSVSRPGVGRKALTFYKDSTKLVDEGNDEKGAVADAIKKSASLFGIAADVYYKELEKYEEIESQQTEDEAMKQKATGKYFAMAQERGMTSEVAKEKIKGAFKKAHMEALTIDQIEHACKLLFKHYQIVEPGQPPLKIGETPILVPLELVVNNASGGDGSITYFCKGPKHNVSNADQVKVKVGEFCSEECKNAYWGSPKSSYDRDWDNLGKSQ